MLHHSFYICILFNSHVLCNSGNGGKYNAVVKASLLPITAAALAAFVFAVASPRISTRAFALSLCPKLMKIRSVLIPRSSPPPPRRGRERGGGMDRPEESVNNCTSGARFRAQNLAWPWARRRPIMVHGPSSAKESSFSRRRVSLSQISRQSTISNNVARGIPISSMGKVPRPLRLSFRALLFV